MDIGVIVVIVLALWSITKTLEKLTDRVLEKQDRQTQLLEDIKAKLESKT
ncbi:hypothetical protein RYX56_00110 [Alkalihalophilus lindianensis]|uniref:Uncharacterized protein n=1 Tax=Alkalihalophilus lindianensis TaxID=1630542 RepID=A0ABU3X4F2_9BACI|nr:hypothetical protein [Alkalihalophilus lindianensis]MDV2682767.1 hypothetical protein [Alkalihalophilus lindianensis]